MYTLSNDQSINYEIDLSLIDLKVYTMFKMDIPECKDNLQLIESDVHSGTVSGFVR